MRHYIKYFGVFLLIAPFLIIGDFIDRKINKFLLVGLFILLAVLIQFSIYEYLAIHGEGVWKIVKGLQTTKIN